MRQVYNSLILATWYKENVKQSLINKVYSDQKKIKGIDIEDKNVREKIYRQYLEAFKKGVYDYIKEDYNPQTEELIPRKYFSGGMNIKPKIKKILNQDEAYQSLLNISNRTSIIASEFATDPSKALNFKSENLSSPINNEDILNDLAGAVKKHYSNKFPMEDIILTDKDFFQKIANRFSLYSPNYKHDDSQPDDIIIGLNDADTKYFISPGPQDHNEERMLIFIDERFGENKVNFINSHIYAKDFGSALEQYLYARFFKELEHRLIRPDGGFGAQIHPDLGGIAGMRIPVDITTWLEDEDHRKQGEFLKRYFKYKARLEALELKKGLKGKSFKNNQLDTDEAVDILESTYNVSRKVLKQLVEDQKGLNFEIKTHTPIDDLFIRFNQDEADVLRLEKRPDNKQVEKIKRHLSKQGRYEVKIFQQRSTGLWYAQKMRALYKDINFLGLLESYKDVSTVYHFKFPYYKEQEGFAYPPSPEMIADLLSYEQNDKRFDISFDDKYVYLYSFSDSSAYQALHLDITDLIQKLKDQADEKVYKKYPKPLSKNMMNSVNDHVYQEFKQAIGSIGINLMRLTWSEFKKGKEDVFQPFLKSDVEVLLDKKDEQPAKKKDITISSTGSKQDHGEYNREVSKSGEVFRQIADDFNKKFGWYGTKVEYDEEKKQYDFQGPVLELYYNQKATVLNGKIIVPYGDNRYIIMGEEHNTISENNEIIFIDDRFGADHAGLRNNQVYARDFASAIHEYTELQLWKQFEMVLSKGSYGSYGENGASTEIYPALKGSGIKIPYNIREWILDNINEAQVLDRFFHYSAQVQQNLFMQKIKGLYIPNIVESVPFLDQFTFIKNASKSVINKYFQDRSQIVKPRNGQVESVVQALRRFDNGLSNVVSLKREPSIKDLNWLRIEVEKGFAYDLKIFQRKLTGQWFIQRMEQEGEKDNYYNFLSEYKDLARVYHIVPEHIGAKYSWPHVPEGKDLTSVITHSDKERVDFMLDHSSIFVYSADQAVSRFITEKRIRNELRNKMEEILQGQNVASKAKNVQTVALTKNDFFNIWKSYTGVLGFKLESYTYDEFEANQKSIFDSFGLESGFSGAQAEDVIISNSEIRNVSLLINKELTETEVENFIDQLLTNKEVSFKSLDGRTFTVFYKEEHRLHWYKDVALLVKEGEEIAGSVGLRLSRNNQVAFLDNNNIFSEIKLGKYSEYYDIYVQEDLQRQGLGQLLMGLSLRLAKRSDFEIKEFKIMHAMSAGVELYKSLGFKKKDVVPDYVYPNFGDDEVQFPAIGPVGKKGAAGSPASKKVGGIDLNPQDLKMKRQGRGVDLDIPLDTSNIQIEGLYPIIINITPVTNLPMLLGIRPSDSTYSNRLSYSAQFNPSFRQFN